MSQKEKKNVIKLKREMIFEHHLYIFIYHFFKSTIKSVGLTIIHM
jgi:hypothetical protein